MKVVQSAIYLQGNKRTLWDFIGPELSIGNRSTLVDLFTGSGTIVLNANREGLFDNIIANDALPQIIALHKYIQNTEDFSVLSTLNDQYGATEEEYYRMRSDYDESLDPALLLLLQCRSNSNMMRFGKKRKNFNIPYGKREYFNVDKVIRHHKLIQGVTLERGSYKVITQRFLQQENDLSNVVFYADPPYYGTSTAIYNAGWSWMDDDILRFELKNLVAKGAKVVYSNVFTNRGVENTILKKWCQENENIFQVKHLNKDYSNSSFRKSKEKTDEVLIISK